jgi:hypothetical protein
LVAVNRRRLTNSGSLVTPPRPTPPDKVEPLPRSVYIFDALGYLARFARAAVLARRRGWVRLVMPAVAWREPLVKAVLTSSRTGARSATTRIP